MTRREFARLFAAAAGTFAAGSGVAVGLGPDAMRRFMNRVRQDLRRFRTEQLGAVNAAGQRLAERVAGGGRLLIFDNRGGYSSEATGRAGGLMAIHRIRAADRDAIAPQDALVIVADQPAEQLDIAMAQAARDRGALVVAICPVRSDANCLARACEIALDNYVTDQDAAIRLPDLGAWIAPTSGVVNTAIMWALFAAYIEAMEKRGKPPHIWMSIKRPGAREFNAAALEAAKQIGY